MSNEPYQQALQKEKAARIHAESLLEDKTQKLIKNNRVLKFKNNALNLLISLIHFTQTEHADTFQTLFRYLEEICLFCQWPLAHIYFVSENNPSHEVTLVPSNIWFGITQDKYKIFIEKTMQTHFKLGEELPGAIMKSLAPQWVEFAHADKSTRQIEGEKLGITCAFGVPLFRYNKIFAIAEFFTDNPSHQKKKYSELAVTVASHISTMLERRISEEKLKTKNAELNTALKELKQVQSQLVQTSKMASLGQLAAGVAHEINNPIGYVSNNLRVLKKYMGIITEIMQSRQQFYNRVSRMLTPEISQEKNMLNENEKTKKIDFIISDTDNLLAESAEGVQRIADIVIGLKSFARLNESEFKEASINECIESTLKVIWSELKYKCEVQKELAELPMIKCNPGQLNQVFMNLLVNASQAIKDKGIIKIKTYLEKDTLCVAISDSGCGIPEKDLHSIFEPFFTTKPIGIGTGLGLSISYGIIEKHGGKIEVDSEIGKGTTFTLKLPIHPVTPALSSTTKNKNIK